MITSYDLNTKNLFASSDAHLKKIWDQFLIIAEKDLGKRVIDSWFRSLKIFSFNEKLKIVTILAPNKFVKEWILKNYMFNLESILGRVFGEKALSVNIIINNEELNRKNFENNLNNIYPAKKNTERLVPEIEYKFEEKNLKKSPTASILNKIKPNQSILNKNFTFENFVYGPGNEIAYSSAQELIEKRSTWYNIFFIHGPSGIGKTHLIQAIGNDLLSKKIPFIYQTSDKFINDYIDAVKLNIVDKFEKTFDYVEVFLIDDIQMISDKLKTQEIFLKLLTTLIQKDKRIVITGDALPRNLKGLSPRIISRIEGGLVVDLALPSIETIIDIIIIKSKSFKIELTKEMAELIAMYASNNIRELEGILIKIATVYSIEKKVFSLEYLRKILSSYKNIQKNELVPVEVNIVIKYICKHFDLKLDSICSSSREKKLLYPRGIIIYIIKKYLNYSCREIAKIFGYKDHTTIVYMIKKIKSKHDQIIPHIENLRQEFSMRQLKFAIKG